MLNMTQARFDASELNSQDFLCGNTCDLHCVERCEVSLCQDFPKGSRQGTGPAVAESLGSNVGWNEEKLPVRLFDSSQKCFAKSAKSCRRS